MANPEFAEFFFIHEHFARYTSDIHSRKGPIYYFIPVFILGVSPWLISSTRALVSPDYGQYFPEAAAFYLGRPIIMVEYEGEMAMGVRLEPGKFIKTQAEFLTIWQNLDQAAVVLKINRLQNLKVDELQGKVVYKGPKTMVIIKS